MLYVCDIESRAKRQTSCDTNGRSTCTLLLVADFRFYQNMGLGSIPKTTSYLVWHYSVWLNYCKWTILHCIFPVKLYSETFKCCKLQWEQIWGNRYKQIIQTWQIDWFIDYFPAFLQFICKCDGESYIEIDPHLPKLL